MPGSFSRHFSNGVSKFQGICFDRSYIPVAHIDYVCINIAIVSMKRLAQILMEVQKFQNIIFSLNE